MNRKALKAQARQCLTDSQDPVKRITLVFLLGIAVLLAIEYGLTELVDRAGSNANYLSQALSAQTRNYVIIVVITVVCQLALILLNTGFQAVALDLSRRVSVGYQTLLEGFRSWAKPIGLYVYISLLQSLWAIAFSFPVSYLLTALFLSGTISQEWMVEILMAYMGIVMFIVSYRYRMAWFVYLDDPEKPIRQIVWETKALNKTHRFELFLLDLSFVPWMLLCALTLGVLLVWKLPYFLTTYACAYEAMREDYEFRRDHMNEILKQELQKQEFQEFGHWDEES